MAHQVVELIVKLAQICSLEGGEVVVLALETYWPDCDMVYRIVLGSLFD